MLNINGEEWRIVLVSPTHPALFMSNGKLTIGSCDDNTKTIYINNQLNNRMIRKVLCHEITHACIFSYNVDLDLAQEELLADLVATYGQEIIQETNKIFCRLKEIRETS